MCGSAYVYNIFMCDVDERMGKSRETHFPPKKRHDYELLGKLNTQLNESGILGCECIYVRAWKAIQVK